MQKELTWARSQSLSSYWTMTWLHLLPWMVVVDACYVMNAGAPLVLVDGIQANEILLRMAGHLGRGSWYHKVSGNAAPIPFTEFRQPYQKQPGKKKAPSTCQRDRNQLTLHRNKAVLEHICLAQTHACCEEAIHANNVWEWESAPIWNFSQLANRNKNVDIKRSCKWQKVLSYKLTLSPWKIRELYSAGGLFYLISELCVKHCAYWVLQWMI